MITRHEVILSACTFLVAVCSGCREKQPDDGAQVAVVASSSASKVSEAVLASICRQEPCGGDRPIVTVYRNGEGRIAKLYRTYGACFHSPGLYFDPDGTLLETIPETPVVVGSPEANAFQARHDKQLKGLVAAEELRCNARNDAPRD